MTFRSIVAVVFVLGPVGFGSAEGSPKPGAGMQDSFPGCTWGEVKGRDLSIWSFTCDGKAGGQHLVADDGLRGFVLKDGTDPKGRVAIRTFQKAADAPVLSVLSAVRAASPGRYTARCVLKEMPSRSGVEAISYSLEPTGPEAKAWKASQDTSAMPDEPCGPLGTSYVGDRMFQQLGGDPTRVVFIDMGSELQIFDPTTLRATPGR